MKNKAIVTLSRNANGEVFGEIIDEKGVIVESKNFGMMTEEEYGRVLKLIEREFPDIGAIEAIELTGN